MDTPIDPRYPDIDFLRRKARKRIPRFAFEYLDGGCNSGVNLKRNNDEIRQVKLNPTYIKEIIDISLETSLFGKTYSAPFGVAPIGLQGLIWPGATEILAKAAFQHNVPFILSTVATASVEKVSEITEGNAWFQLYYPSVDTVRNDLLNRIEKAGIKTLVVLCDVPTFGYRSREIKNGLSIPPRMTFNNMVEIISHPTWALQTLIKGQPNFQTLKPYMTGKMSLKHLGLFMNKTFDGRLNQDKLKELREKWKGNLVLKGVSSLSDAETAIQTGFEGIIVSNHGGRQLDNGESSIQAMHRIAKAHNSDITIMMDSGIRTGPDIAASMAMGAEFTFLGRSFMYGVAALGKKGGHQTISILKKQLQQVLEQLRCPDPKSLPRFLIEE